MTVEIISSQWLADNLLDPKIKIIEVSSAYEFRLTLGKRHIIHLEGYINTIIYVLNIKSNKVLIKN